MKLTDMLYATLHINHDIRILAINSQIISHHTKLFVFIKQPI